MATFERFEIDADITRAATLPARAYSDPAVYASQRELVLARSWQLVGTLDDVKVPGQTHPVTLLEGCLDEPLLLTRDREDRVHCLSNVCTHRGTILCEHGGVEKSLGVQVPRSALRPRWHVPAHARVHEGGGVPRAK